MNTNAGNENPSQPYDFTKKPMRRILYVQGRPRFTRSRITLEKSIFHKEKALEKTSSLMTLQGLRPAAMAPQLR